MKTIGIIGAMDEEVAFMKELAEIVSVKNMLGLDFYIGKYAGNSVIIVKCGIGKVNAAACTQALIDHFGVDCVINVGVAGAVYKELNIGDIVISIEHAMKQAELYGHSLDREIAFLTVHSMLHLLGYDHEPGGLELVRMREKEEAVLTQLGLVRSGSYYTVE